jgi:hypothetical protein
VTRSEHIGGWLAVEDERLEWDAGIFDREMKIVICGELEHVRHLLWVAAWREACREDLRRLLAQQAGTE